MITFDQVSKRYGERLALDSVSWGMNEGEFVVFLGHSGAGKTTLLRLITHEIQPTAGRVVVGTFQGGRLTRRQRALLRRTLGIIYEDFRLLGDRTVFENVALAVRIAGHFRDEDVVPRVQFALEEVGLSHQANAFPGELSAGEKQRAAIARAIVNRPAVILADEPTGALETRSSEDVLALLRRIHAEGAAIVLVTTRREVAESVPGRLIEMSDGRIVGGIPQPAAPAPPPVAETVPPLTSLLDPPPAVPDGAEA
jgi:cell division transport system ATP-binding protein